MNVCYTYNKKQRRSKLKKNEKGITLIALVITIIVLIILAGITIAAVIGDNGIITKAQQSANQTQEARKEEEQ